jgi:glyoxylase-like metal-dependent hydrolase (beta-lactamase superfamily II)
MSDGHGWPQTGSMLPEDECTDQPMGNTGGVLTEIADGVLIRQSGFCQSNAVVVRGRGEALLVDPGVDGHDLEELADDLSASDTLVTAGFSTHPHWDHLLWHDRFGEVRRYGTTSCAAVARARLTRLQEVAARLAPGIQLDLVGAITALPRGSSRVPWSGPTVRIIEHQAHAPGHGALLIEDSGVLVAGDMLSDVEIPLFDPEAADPCSDYLMALDLLAAACSKEVTVLIPGHGSVAHGPDIRSRIDADRRYVEALRAGTDPRDPRVGSDASYGADWLPEAHERNMHLARR